MLRKLFLYCYAFCRVFEDVQYYMSRGRRKPECICKTNLLTGKYHHRQSGKTGRKEQLMKTMGNIRIIGVDAGYGNMKTANFCFRTGVDRYDTEPLFNREMLIYEGKYYLIGSGHKTYTAEKTADEDFYILTLAATAMELSREEITEADVHLAAGLPLTWVTEQKASYRAYLLQNERVQFVFRKTEYRIHFVGADVFPQGYAAIA